MKVAETSSTWGFEDPSGLFTTFFQFSFSDVLIKVSLFSDGFEIDLPWGMFSDIKFLKMVEVVNFLVFECGFEIFLDEERDVIVLDFGWLLGLG